MRRVPLPLVLLLCSLGILYFFDPGFAQAPKLLGPDETEILNTVNKLRGMNGLHALQTDPLLTEAAGEHSRDMAGRGVPDIGLHVYKTPFERAEAKRVTDMHNEVFVAQSLSLKGLKGEIQSDEGTDANVLSPDMTHIGIGIYTGDNGIKWLTIHMVERVLALTDFRIEAGFGVDQKKTITICGKTHLNRIKAELFFGDDPSKAEVVSIKGISPDSDEHFCITLPFTKGKGHYCIMFGKEENSRYTRTNYFKIQVN